MWHTLSFVAESRRLDAQQLTAFALAHVDRYGILNPVERAVEKTSGRGNEAPQLQQPTEVEVNTWHVDLLVNDYRAQVMDISPAALLSAGFTPVTYSGQSQVYLRRDTAMPMLKAAMTDLGLKADDVAITEVRPNGQVSLLIPATGHAEEADARKPDGQALLKDSIAGQVQLEMLEI